ncbi:uncharacterized protein DUF3159 [Krasilnikovia cinnamomea]|uniref:Uncharacterized protein DUF3159 n=1 Tax=Krasilnikovia cinnamomea TaxID=349313 RepID=A0A4Q7ZFU4_9ACTN|nr:uncharacterized protein DUF3159 [Krasilnikovia cinnamomea]
MTPGSEPRHAAPREGVEDRVAEEVVEALNLHPVTEEVAEELSLNPGADGDQPAREPVAEGEEPLPTMSEQIADQLGGMRGLIESSVPVLAFVLLNFIVGLDAFGLPEDSRTGLYIAIGGAVGTAVVIAIYRLARREPIRHAINGLIGIALGAYLAARSGQAKDFYLPGILITLGQAALLLLSTAFRRPIIGYVWAVMANKGKHDWLENKRLLGTFQWLTVAWAVSLIVRGGVQALLYWLDRPDLLGVARIFLSWPIYAGMLALTVWAVRRATRAERAAQAAA